MYAGCDCANCTKLVIGDICESILRTGWWLHILQPRGVCHVDGNCVSRYGFEGNVPINWVVFEDLVINSFVTVKLVISVAISVFLVSSVDSFLTTEIVEVLDLLWGSYCCCPVSTTLSEYVWASITEGVQESPPYSPGYILWSFLDNFLKSRSALADSLLPVYDWG